MKLIIFTNELSQAITEKKVCFKFEENFQKLLTSSKVKGIPKLIQRTLIGFCYKVFQGALRS